MFKFLIFFQNFHLFLSPRCYGSAVFLLVPVSRDPIATVSMAIIEHEGQNTRWNDGSLRFCLQIFSLEYAILFCCDVLLIDRTN
jgi:hypothetical protein